jgi:dihydrofolate synthase/folylpolyglutamate synthase
MVGRNRRNDRISRCGGRASLPLPRLAGRHQAENAALAVALIRHQDAVTVSPEAMAAGILAARWPARLQRLGDGPLTALAGGRAVWLDGGHNPDAGLAIARHFADAPKFHLITGMLANKDPSAIIAPLAGKCFRSASFPRPAMMPTARGFRTLTALPAQPFEDVEQALRALPAEGDVLIAGSLYLAGDVLRRNLEFPD